MTMAYVIPWENAESELVEDAYLDTFDIPPNQLVIVTVSGHRYKKQLRESRPGERLIPEYPKVILKF